jgi:hypothetical protein
MKWKALQNVLNDVAKSRNEDKISITKNMVKLRELGLRCN